MGIVRVRALVKEIGGGLFTRKATAHLTKLPKRVDHSDPTAAAEAGKKVGGGGGGGESDKTPPGSRPSSASGPKSPPAGKDPVKHDGKNDVPTENVLKGKIPAPFSTFEVLTVLEAGKSSTIRSYLLYAHSLNKKDLTTLRCTSVPHTLVF